MKNLLSGPPDEMIKILTVSFCVGLPVIVGFLLPPPFDDSFARLVDAGLSLAMAVFVWGVFHLIEPSPYSRKWRLAEVTVVPLVWLLIITALGVGFYHLRDGMNGQEEGIIDYLTA